MCRTPTRRVNQLLDLADQRIAEGNPGAAAVLVSAANQSMESIATVKSTNGVPIGTRIRQLQSKLKGQQPASAVSAVDIYD